MTGPVYEPGRWEVESFLDFRDFAFDSPLTWIKGRLTNINGRMSLQGTTLEAQNIALQLGEVPLRLSGKVSRELIDLRVSYNTPLTSLQQVFPVFLRDFEVGGEAEGFCRLRLAHRGADGPTTGAALADLERAGSDVADDLAADYWPYDYTV